MDQKLQESILENALLIQEHRKALHEAREKSIEAKEEYKDAEARYVITGIIGKNEQERTANLRRFLEEYRKSLSQAERVERIAALNLELSLDARRSLESIVKLMEAENGL